MFWTAIIWIYLYVFQPGYRSSISGRVLLFFFFFIRLELPKLCYHPGWRLMWLGYRTCFHTLYDEKKISAYFNRETGVQFLVESYQRLKNWYLIPPCFTLNIIIYVPIVKWSNTGKGQAFSSTFRCSSYWKKSFQLSLDYGHQLYFYFILILWAAMRLFLMISCNKDAFEVQSPFFSGF